MFVGGCGEIFYNQKIEDIDIATIFTPNELKEKITKNTKFKIIDTGLEHGSVTVVSENNKFEFTTLRKDIKTDGRHAEIEIIEMTGKKILKKRLYI